MIRVSRLSASGSKQHAAQDQSDNRLRRHRKINDPVAGAWAGALAAFVLGKILEIALLFLRFFLRARSRLRSADAPGLVSFILRCLLKASPVRPYVRRSAGNRTFHGQLVGPSDKLVVVTSQSHESPTLIADRYRVEKTLGKGGMAIVYQVRDGSTGKKMALKRLRPLGTELKLEKATRLFEHEYYTLSQLAHPRVIAVYDYGLDDEGPFYTMELLEGGALRERSPLPWREACSIMIDICSALSLLHSRRQVHRDLTPRNVHCTLDGKAKLIDFGAMVPMGPSKQIVGTPAFTAPEVVYSQALDARTDLYSLGATGYFALTGRNAYAASSFDNLRTHWRSPPRPPSAFRKEVPKNLDHLVMSLLNLDVLSRPGSAAEVMERLSAIAGLTVDEQLVASQSYLSTPVLAGRNEQVARIRKLMFRALKGRGGTVMIEGDEGVGRSRFLDACVLEGKLVGANVLRIEASDKNTGDWGAVLTALLQLLDAAPELVLETIAAYLPVIGHISDDLLGRLELARTWTSRAVEGDPWQRFPSSLPPPENAPGHAARGATGDNNEPAGDETPDDPRAEVWDRGRSVPPPANRNLVELEPFESPHHLRPRLQSALRDFLLEIGSRRCLVLAADDLHALDEPSAAFLAYLAHHIADQRIVLLATARTGATRASKGMLKLLSESGLSVKLRNLTLENTETLLGSVFGDAPNLKLLADRLFTMTEGNPRAIMQIAQALVDQGVVRYETGTWTLPSRMDAKEFPETLGEVIRIRIRILGEAARQLAQAMALSPEQSFSFEECRLLTEHGDSARTMRYLDELIASKVLSTDREFYTVSHRGWVDELGRDLDADKRRLLHLRLATVFEARPQEGFRVAQHLLHGGEEERALDTLLRINQENRERFEKSAEHRYAYVQSLPRTWVETYQALRGVCTRLGRPKHQVFWLHRDFVNQSIVKDASNKESLVALTDVLYDLCGLKAYHDLPDSMEPSERLKRALDICQQRYDAASDDDKIIPPFEAIVRIVQAVVLAIKVAGTAFDHALIAGMPSLEPLLPLSPALWVAEVNRKSTEHITAARYEEARKGYLAIIERMAQPDRAGLDESRYGFINLSVMYAVGAIEASMGLASCLKWANAIETNPAFSVNAYRIRMVYYVRLGLNRKAEQCKREIELLQIRNSPIQYFEGTHLFTEILVYASSGDLMKAKQTLAEIETMASVFETWQPVLWYARGEYQRLRGDYESAAREHRKVLEATSAGQHIVWPSSAGSLVRALIDLDRADEAVETGRELLQLAEASGLDIASTYVRTALSLAEAAVSDFESAVSHAEYEIDNFKAHGTIGINLGAAYETRARIAIAMADEKAFRSYARLCFAEYRVEENACLTAKYDKLVADGLDAGMQVSVESATALPAKSRDGGDGTGGLVDLITECRGPEERAEAALRFLVEQGGATAGFLYTVQKDGPSLSAALGGQPFPVDLDSMVRQYLDAEIEGSGDITVTTHDLEPPSETKAQWSEYREGLFRPALLGHDTEQGFAITGLAVLVLEPDAEITLSGEAIESISRSLFDAGDVATMYAAI